MDTSTRKKKCVGRTQSYKYNYTRDVQLNINECCASSHQYLHSFTKH